MNNASVVRHEAAHWYLYLIAGLLFLAMGVWVWKTPLESYLALTFLFSLTFLVSGGAETYFAIANKNAPAARGWGWDLLGGVVNLLLGVVLLTHPALSAATLPIYVGALVLFRSAMALSLVVATAGTGGSARFWIGALATLGLLFGIVLIWNPALAGMTAVAWTAMGLASYGIAQIFMSFELKQVKSMAI